jgi:hypothetical protein
MDLKKKCGLLLIGLGILLPLISFFLSAKYEGEGSWTNRLYEGEMILKEGVRVKELKREGMAAIPKAAEEAVKKDAERIVDPRLSKSEKAAILASADPEFEALPPAEREKVLAVLTPGELAGVYIAAAGYRPEQILGAVPYVGRTSIPYRYILAGGIILIFLGALLRVF